MVGKPFGWLCYDVYIVLIYNLLTVRFYDLDLFHHTTGIVLPPYFVVTLDISVHGRFLPFLYIKYTNYS
jgi:hypothetical protein